jgi:hypothetical protein
LACGGDPLAVCPQPGSEHLDQFGVESRPYCCAAISPRSQDELREDAARSSRIGGVHKDATHELGVVHVSLL